MIARWAAATVSAAGAAAVAAALLSSNGSHPPRAAGSVAHAEPTTAASPEKHRRGVIVGCSRRSEADFPGAFTDSRNMAVGPLALMGGGAYTSASTVREYGGNKFQLLVKAGHTVTIRLAREVRGSAGLAYGGLGRRPLPDGPVLLRDAADTMRFVACPPGKPSARYRPEGPSGNYADGEPITFWSGFILTRTPACLPLEVYVDRDPTPRRVGLALGRRCRSGAIANVTCDAGGAGTTEIVPKRDLVIGPLVLIGAGQTARHPPNAFDRHGYKIPMTLPEGTTATLSVPRRLSDRVGLVFSHATQDRVRRIGVGGADRAVRFTACQPDREPGRTGWPGGIVVDRRRCVALVLRVRGANRVNGRVPLGRRC